VRMRRIHALKDRVKVPDDVDTTPGETGVESIKQLLGGGTGVHVLPGFRTQDLYRSYISKVYLGSCVQYSCILIAETPQLPSSPPPAFGLIYEGAVGRPRPKIDDISL
jgi:hypothetical protein